MLLRDVLRCGIGEDLVTCLEFRIIYKNVKVAFKS